MGTGEDEREEASDKGCGVVAEVESKSHICSLLQFDAFHVQFLF